MLRTMLDARPLVALIVAAGVGGWGISAYPLPIDNVFLEIIALRNPPVFHALAYIYATGWFTTPFLAASLLMSVARDRGVSPPAAVPRALRSRATRTPEGRSTPMLVLGEAHFASTPGRAPDPTWLTIPQRGLYTGVMIVGAVGTGKTSACMYPYVDQLVRWRADDPDRKLGGLVLEVKGDFCGQVRSMLAQAGRQDDYLEVGLDTGVCYNPLHNDLDPYAVAYAVATLLNNLFGKSKEPFWQQAYTDLLKFVISLRRITDGYTTLAEVYRYIIEDDKIDKNIRTLKAQFAQPQEVIAIRCEEYQGPLRQLPWTLWTPHGRDACGASVRCRARRAPGGPPHPLRGPDRRRGHLRRPSPPARSHRSVVHQHVAEARLEGQGLDRRGRRGVSVACSTRTRRSIAPSAHPARSTPTLRSQANRDRSRRSKTCSKPATSWASIFRSR